MRISYWSSDVCSSDLTTRFLDAIGLKPYAPACKHFDEDVRFLFNSYYGTCEARQPRPRRGMVTRFALSHILDYRKHVDDALDALLRRSTVYRSEERLVGKWCVSTCESRWSRARYKKHKKQI